MTSTGSPAEPRHHSRRDRHGRGRRGPAVLPGPLAPDGVPAARGGPREEFDELVVTVVQRLERRWARELGLIEFAVEEAPLVPDDWQAFTVPLASVVRGTGGRPTRLVVFRRPIELRCEDRAELAAMIFAVLVEQVSELLGRAPEEVDPGYEADDPEA